MCAHEQKVTWWVITATMHPQSRQGSSILARKEQFTNIDVDLVDWNMIVQVTTPYRHKWSKFATGFCAMGACHDVLEWETQHGSMPPLWPSNKDTSISCNAPNQHCRPYESHKILCIRSLLKSVLPLIWKKAMWGLHCEGYSTHHIYYSQWPSKLDQSCLEQLYTQVFLPKKLETAAGTILPRKHDKESPSTLALDLLCCILQTACQQYLYCNQVLLQLQPDCVNYK